MTIPPTKQETSTFIGDLLLLGNEEFIFIDMSMKTHSSTSSNRDQINFFHYLSLCAVLDETLRSAN